VEEQKQIADEKTEALAKAEREVASLEGKLTDVTRELGAAKAAAEARAEAGKNVAAVEEKFERHKKLLDEKVRTLAKAESDVRALEGKLEDAARELAAAKAETAETAAAKAADKARTTDAGQELESMREKFEKHKKFADEKVRALAKAESDVRALEGKLERSMEESNARLAEATERASSLEREHKIAVESAAADASRAKDLAEELDSARKETAETAAKLATLERTHATHATRTATLEKSLDESRLEVKAKAEAAREFAGKLGELSDAKEKLEKELETARAYANKARGDSEKAAEARAETDAKARAFAEEKRAERIASMAKEHKESVSKLVSLFLFSYGPLE
jgi:chromosome segregation ATPase